MPQYAARQGDCISSIAKQFGFTWETIWNHPQNAALKAQRTNPNVLLPGDVVFVPERQIKLLDAATDQLHKYVRSDVTAKIRLRMLDLDRNPRAGLKFSGNVDGSPVSGESDSDGYITIPASPTAQQLALIIQDGANTEQYSLSLGHIDPVDSSGGVQQRLTNLGYACESDGDSMKSAIKAFQEEMHLDASGEMDDATRQQLLTLHGC